MAWWLGLQGEGRLVSRESSGWIKSSLLWAVVGEKESPFLSVPALLMLSALMLALSGSGCLAPCLWLRVCSRRGCCLLSLLLTADSLPALVTLLKPSCFLTSDCKVKPFMKLMAEMVPCCLVLLCITFLSLELADRAAVEYFNLLKCCIHLRKQFVSRTGCRQAEDLSWGGKNERRWGPGCRCGSKSLGALWFVWSLTLFHCLSDSCFRRC